MGNDEATCYVGSLAAQVTEDLLRELFIQVGPIVHLTLKKTDSHSYALVEFDDEDSVPFALEIMDGVKLFHVPISVKPRNNTKQEEIWKKALNAKKYGTPDQSRGDRGDQRSADRNRRYDQQPVVVNMLTPPPPPPPILGYASPSVNRMQPGYKVGSAGRDHWHTPPNANMLNPRIPPEFAGNRSRDHEQSRGGGNSWSAPRHDDRRNSGGWNNDDRRERRYDNRNDDRREEQRRSHGNHRERYNQSGGSHNSTPRNYGGGRRY